MSIEHRVLVRAGGKLRWYAEDNFETPCCTSAASGQGLCPSCAGAYDDLVASGLIKPAPATRAAAKPKPSTTIAFRAAHRGADGRTPAERAADAELVAELKHLGSGRKIGGTRAEPPMFSATRRRPVHPPEGGYSRALGRSITRPRGLTTTTTEQPTPEERAEDQADDAEVQRLYGIILAGLPFLTEDTLLGLDRETLEQWAEQILAEREETERAAAAAPRGYSKALAAKRTAEQRAAAEIEATSRETELPDGKPWPYARTLAREQTLAEVASGRQERLERPRKSNPATPPRGYTAALKRQQEAA